MGISIFYVVCTILITLLLLITAKGIQTIPLTSIAVSLLSGFFWIALTLVSYAFVIGRPSMYYWLIVVPGILVVLTGLFSIGSLVGAILLVIFLLAARRAVHREMEGRIEFRTVTVFYHGTKFVTMGILMMALGLSVLPVKDYIEQGALNLPEQSMALFMRPLTPFIRGYIEGYSEEKSVNDLVDIYASRQAERMGIPPRVIPQQQKNQLLLDISDRFGVSLRGNETVPAVVAQVVNKRIGAIAAQSSVLVVGMLVIVALFLVRAIVPFLVWPSLIFVGLLMLIARVSELVTVKDVSVKAQRLFLDEEKQ